MKKAVSILLMFVAFLIIYFLQVNFFSWFNIAGVMPNLFVVLILIIGLFAGKYAGISTGVVAGLFLDIFISKKIGVTAITLGLVGFIGALLEKNFSKDSRITLVLMVTILTLLYDCLLYTSGYCEDKAEMQNRINEYMDNGSGENVAFVEINDLPEYKMCLLKKGITTDDDEIFQKVIEKGKNYYTYYALSLIHIYYKMEHLIYI